MSSSTLRIKDYEVKVHLGCSADERKLKQKVLFNVEIIFKQKVLAQETDLLHDSIDYVHLTEIIKRISEKKSYNMIEHLCFSVAQAIQDSFRNLYVGSLLVRLNKIQVPIENLNNGVEWSCQIDL